MQRAVRQVCLFLACLLVGSVQAGTDPMYNVEILLLCSNYACAVTDGYEGDKAVQILNFDQEGTLNDLPELLGKEYWK